MCAILELLSSFNLKYFSEFFDQNHAMTVSIMSFYFTYKRCYFTAPQYPPCSPAQAWFCKPKGLCHVLFKKCVLQQTFSASTHLTPQVSIKYLHESPTTTDRLCHETKHQHELISRLNLLLARTVFFHFWKRGQVVTTDLYT